MTKNIGDEKQGIIEFLKKAMCRILKNHRYYADATKLQESSHTL